jgi:hypothetical protein
MVVLVRALLGLLVCGFVIEMRGMRLVEWSMSKSRAGLACGQVVEFSISLLWMEAVQEIAALYTCAFISEKCLTCLL